MASAQKDGMRMADVQIRFTVDGGEQEIGADFLIVACDPRNLFGIANYTDTETPCSSGW